MYSSTAYRGPEVSLVSQKERCPSYGQKRFYRSVIPAVVPSRLGLRQAYLFPQLFSERTDGHRGQLGPSVSTVLFLEYFVSLWPTFSVSDTPIPSSG